jgi:hypothetical protein
MMSFRNCQLCIISAVLMAGISTCAFAQGWGEQAPVQFKYSNQGMTSEVYRMQLGATAAAAAAAASASGGGFGGGLQSSSNLNNAVQINNNATYNVTVSGDSNYLNFGDTVNAQQSSTGTQQSSSNTSSTTSGASKILNK